MKATILQKLDYKTMSNFNAELLLTHHSCAIEGNTFTLRETQVAMEGITIGGKHAREHFEIWGHQKAIDYLNQWVASGDPLTEGHIKAMHQLVLFGMQEAWGGQYRRENVVITGAKTTPNHWHQIPHEMGVLLKWNEPPHELDFWERIAQFHYRFEAIHPFMDGNGRTGRLLLCFESLRAGKGWIVITKENRLRYLEALDTAPKDITPLRDLILDSLIGKT